MTALEQPPAGPESPEPSEGAKARRPLLHPLSGALILGLDWVLFSGTFATGGTGVLAASVAGFVLGGLGTALIQRKRGGDSRRVSAMKGFAAGVTVGAPLPVAGTVVGGLILGLSGLDRLKRVLSAGKG